MWQVIYIAPNKQAAEQLRDALTAEGILVNLRMSGVTGNNGNAHVEVLVPRGEVRDAQEALHAVLGRSHKK